MHLGVVEPARVVVALDVRRRLQANERTQLARVLEREIEHDAPADRAAHDHRPLELQLARDGHDHGRVRPGGEAVVLALPAFRRRRLAVPRHVERDDAPVAQEFCVIEHRAPLAAVGAGGMEAKKRDAGASLLVIDAMHAPVERDVRVAADDGLDHRRSVASSSLRYSR